jgi:hypothetical protein
MILRRLGLECSFLKRRSNLRKVFIFKVVSMVFIAVFAMKPFFVKCLLNI